MKVVLKPGKDKACKNRHHWIFSGACQSIPPSLKGEILPVYSSQDELLGHAYFNSSAQIIGRMVSFGEEEPLAAIKRHISQAIKQREKWFQEDTTGYRVVNGEGDFLPGLIVDRYGEAWVMQVGTMGMDLLKNLVVETLREAGASSIYEKSELSTRKEEGLPPFQGQLFGPPAAESAFLENGLKFIASIKEGQKTGFFSRSAGDEEADQTAGVWFKSFNAFSYSGGFTIAALKGGAAQVDSVDISAKAIDLVKRHVELNGLKPALSGYFVEDVFKFLREKPLDYDLVILDPPAFAKRKKDIIPACRGYKDINRLAMAKMPPNSYLLTCSCSYFVDENLFQKVLFQAACEAKRECQIVSRHELAIDHPLNICHPEGDYLKSFLLYIA